MPPKSVAIIPGATVKYREYPVFYPFSQNSNFAYLTGFLEPDSLAVIDRRGSEPYFHLLVREKDEEREKWDGPRSGTQAALDVFNADESGNIDDVRRKLPRLLEGADYVLTDLPGSHQPNTDFGKFFGNLPSDPLSSSGMLGELLAKFKERNNVTVRSLSPLVHKLRVVKSDAEIFNMRTAGKISGRAFTDAMRQAWSSEKDLHSFLDYNFRVGGCDREAYVPVVAGGQHGQTIHYTQNDQPIKQAHFSLS
jgi:intermediate cleaving peptidase 55